jgi:hypothetical protein
MVRAPLFLSLSVLFTFSILYAAEEKKEKAVRTVFCDFHSAERVEAEKEAKKAGKELKPSGMKSVCIFNKEHEKDTLIMSIHYPDLTAWHDTDNDSFDAYIAGFRKIPYLYEQIKKQPNVNAYVLKCEYESLHKNALMYLGEKEKQLSDRSEDEPIRRRIQEYVTILRNDRGPKYPRNDDADKGPKYDASHECIGLIVSIRAVMVALQWAHFADDHTDKGEEDLKKMLSSMVSNVANKLTNNSEVGDPSESFDPRRETPAEYQLKQAKKYDPCGWW